MPKPKVKVQKNNNNRVIIQMCAARVPKWWVESISSLCDSWAIEKWFEKCASNNHLSCFFNVNGTPAMHFVSVGRGTCGAVDRFVWKHRLDEMSEGADSSVIYSLTPSPSLSPSPAPSSFRLLQSSHFVESFTSRQPHRHHVKCVRLYVCVKMPLENQRQMQTC